LADKWKPILVYKVAQKVSHYQVIKNRSKAHLNLSMRLDLFVKLKYQASTKIYPLVLNIKLTSIIPNRQTSNVRHMYVE